MSRDAILRKPANETITYKGLADVATSLQLLSSTLALQLRIKVAEWTCIDKDKKDEIEKKFEILHHWYKQTPPETTYGDLRELITTGFEVKSDQVPAMDCNDVIPDSGDLPANKTDDGTSDGTNTNSLVTHLTQATQEAIELTKENLQLKEENSTFKEVKEQNLKLRERNNELENENTELKAHCGYKRKRKNTNSLSKNQKKIKEYFAVAKN